MKWQKMDESIFLVMVQLNPIHGADLVKICVDAVFQEKEVLEVGGPTVLSHQDIAEEAFAAVNKPTKIIYIPDWVRRFLLRMAAIFQSKLWKRNSFSNVDLIF